MCLGYFVVWFGFVGVHLMVIFVQAWDYFGLILWSFCGLVRIILGWFKGIFVSSWDYFGVILRSFWGHFGIILGSS